MKHGYWGQQCQVVKPCHIVKSCHKIAAKWLLKRQEGTVEWVVGLFQMLILVILLAAHMQYEMWYTTSQYMEDALAASNLASAVADIEEYGKTNVLCISDANKSFELYLKALRINLQLDEQWESSNKVLISGKVEVLEYIIYNVMGNDIAIYRRGSTGSSTYLETGGLGRIRTPDGVPVESTTVYSRIGFWVDGFLGINVYAEKEKTVDIISTVVAVE